MTSIALYSFFLVLVFFQLRTASRLEDKYQVHFLTYFRTYLIFYFIYGFVKFVGILFNYQFVPFQDDRFPTVRVFAILIFPFFAFVLYYLMLWIRHLTGKNTSAKIIILFWSSQFVLFLLMTYRYFIVQDLPLLGAGRSWHSIHIPLVMILFIIVGQLFIFKKDIQIEIKKTFAKNLGIIYMFFFALYEAFQQLGGLFVGENDFTYYVIGGVVYFCINIPALVYIHHFMASHSFELLTPSIQFDRMDLFCQKYSITSREREIIEMIIKGHTNKSIGDILYISVQTVKNTNYNIYKKTKVKNRLQLLNLIQNFNETGDNRRIA